MVTENATTPHGSAVAVGEQGLLITGAPGSGKSTLALELIALGARLVADDRVGVALHGGQLTLSAPENTPGLIEARGIGILRLDHVTSVPLHLIVDLDKASDQRLPARCHRRLLDRDVPVIFGKGRHGLAAILTVLLSGADLLDPDAPIDA